VEVPDVHEWFDEVLAAVQGQAGVRAAIGSPVIGEVLARVAWKAPHDTSRVEIAEGTARPTDRMALTAGTVSKAVQALTSQGMLARGTEFRVGPGGRPVEPIRFGDRYLLAGVKVEHKDRSPVAVTSVLASLGGEVLRERVATPLPSRDGPESWARIVDTMSEEIKALLTEEQRKRKRAAPA